MNDTTNTRVLAELTIDEASVLVGLARTQGLIELADKVQGAIMEAAENPVLAVKALELNKPDLVGTKDTNPVILAQTQTAAVDETAKLSTGGANGQQNSQLPLSTQTSAAFAAGNVVNDGLLGGAIGSAPTDPVANTDGEGSEA